MKLIAEISTYVILVPLTLALLRHSKFTSIQKGLSWLIYVAALFQATSTTIRYLGMTNIPLFHLYPLISLGLLSFIYQFTLRLFFPRWLIPVLTISLIIFSLFNSLFIQSIFEFSSNTLSLVSVLLVFYALSYFYKLLSRPPKPYLELNPMFWINCGVITYYSGSFIIFMYSNYMLPKSIEAQRILWGLHALFNIFNYLLYSIALWVREKI